MALSHNPISDLIMVIYICQTKKININKREAVYFTEEARLTMFERATLSFGTIRVTSNVALWVGSSQHGRARRASAAYKERGGHTSHTLMGGHAHTYLKLRHSSISFHLGIRRAGIFGPVETSHLVIEDTSIFHCHGNIANC